MGSRLRRALLGLLVASLVAALLIVLPQFGPEPVQTAPTAEARIRLHMVFPVRGRVWYANNFGACRAGCRRRHQGVDIMGHKMQRLYAAADGRVTVFRHAPRGNYLTITTRGGWSFNYVHLNNDRPGTDDGRNLRRYAFAPGLHLGSRVRAGQFIAYMGDSGNAERTVPHLHFEIRKGYGWTGKVVNPYWSLRTAGPTG